MTSSPISTSHSRWSHKHQCQKSKLGNLPGCTNILHDNDTHGMRFTEKTKGKEMSGVKGNKCIEFVLLGPAATASFSEIMSRQRAVRDLSTKRTYLGQVFEFLGPIDYGTSHKNVLENAIQQIFFHIRALLPLPTLEAGWEPPVQIISPAQKRTWVVLEVCTTSLAGESRYMIYLFSQLKIPTWQHPSQFILGCHLFFCQEICSFKAYSSRRQLSTE